MFPSFHNIYCPPKVCIISSNNILICCSRTFNTDTHTQTRNLHKYSRRDFPSVLMAENNTKHNTRVLGKVD